MLTMIYILWHNDIETIEQFAKSDTVSKYLAVTYWLGMVYAVTIDIVLIVLTVFCVRHLQ